MRFADKVNFLLKNNKEESLTLLKINPDIEMRLAMFYIEGWKLCIEVYGEKKGRTEFPIIVELAIKDYLVNRYKYLEEDEYKSAVELGFIHKVVEALYSLYKKS